MMECRLALESGYANEENRKGFEKALRFRQAGLCVNEKWVRLWI